MEYCILIEVSDSAVRHRHVTASLVGCQLYLQFGVL